MLTNTTEKRLALAVVSVSIVAACMVSHRSKKKNKQKLEAKIQILQTEVVQPSPLPESQRETLSEVDEWLSKSSHWLSFCVRFDSLINYETVKTGLQRTMQHIPALAARVDTSKFLHELVLDPDNCGVVLEYARGTANSTTELLPDDTYTRNDWVKFGLNGPSAGYEGLPKITDPLMRAKLITFDDKCSYLSVGISHALCDGHGIADLLQVWSHFCNTDSPNSLPQNLRQPRLFGHRQFQPARPAKSPQELDARRLDDAGCTSSPFTLSYLLGNMLFQAIWCMSRQEIFEVRVDAGKVAQLKSSMTKHLAKDEWVSTFEVLVSAYLVATNIQTANLMNHNLHVSCDLRGRSKRFQADYFGNAAFDFCKQLKLSGKLTWDMENLKAVAQAVHSVVRSGIADPEFVSKTKDWFEAARHLGLKNTYDVWRPAVDAIHGTGTFVNSWGQRWLDISMGSSQKASSMVAYFGMVQNFLVEVPRHRETKDSTIIMALPPNRLKHFLALCELENSKPGSMFPFTVQNDKLVG